MNDGIKIQSIDWNVIRVVNLGQSALGNVLETIGIFSSWFRAVVPVLAAVNPMLPVQASAKVPSYCVTEI
jgi:hypothetical protein